MPVLSNAKWEKFAQAIAKGETADAAYVAAGYKENRGNAARLKATESIMKRIEELQTKVADRVTQALALSAESITQDLMRIAKEAQREGGPSGLNVARAAWMDIAKLNGMVIERAETRATVHTISSEPLSPEEWAVEHAGAAAH